MSPLLEVRRLPLAFDAAPVAVVVAPHAVVFALGDGTFRAVSEHETRIDGHDGVSLGLAVAGDDVLSAGDDGRLLAIGADSVAREVARFGKVWLNAVAAAPETGLVAVAAGKRVHVLDRQYKEVAVFEHPSTVAALAFDPRGKKVAAAHYNGVSVWMAASRTAARRPLEWKGSHVAALWSPCGRFIVTSMQENAVHGWRVEDGADFRMDGYPMRPKSLAFVARGKALATTGAGAEVLLWPFVGPKGPMGRSAEVVAADDEAVAELVSGRPKSSEFVVGYRNGAIRLFSADGGEGYVLDGATGAPVTALAWSGDGKLAAYGRQDGSGAVVSAAPTSTPS